MWLIYRHTMTLLACTRDIRTIRDNLDPDDEGSPPQISWRTLHRQPPSLRHHPSFKRAAMQAESHGFHNDEEERPPTNRFPSGHRPFNPHCTGGTASAIQDEPAAVCKTAYCFLAAGSGSEGEKPSGCFCSATRCLCLGDFQSCGIEVLCGRFGFHLLNKSHPSNPASQEVPFLSFPIVRNPNKASSPSVQSAPRPSGGRQSTTFRQHSISSASALSAAPVAFRQVSPSTSNLALSPAAASITGGQQEDALYQHPGARENMLRSEEAARWGPCRLLLGAQLPMSVAMLIPASAASPEASAEAACSSASWIRHHLVQLQLRSRPPPPCAPEVHLRQVNLRHLNPTSTPWRKASSAMIC